jgi:hypothetical protein
VQDTKVKFQILHGYTILVDKLLSFSPFSLVFSCDLVAKEHIQIDQIVTTAYPYSVWYMFTCEILSKFLVRLFSNQLSCSHLSRFLALEIILAEFCYRSNVVYRGLPFFLLFKNLNFTTTEMNHLSLYSDLTRNYINGSIPASLAELPNLQTL